MSISASVSPHVRLQVHGQPMHKVEALDRGALQSLARACLAHRSQHLRAHATRAVRSVCFKNDEGRNRAIASGALAASVRVLAEALDVLEYHGSGGATTRQLAALIVAPPASESASAAPAAPATEVVLLTAEESAPELAAADAFAALVVVEEAANTLSALVNRHGASRAPGCWLDVWLTFTPGRGVISATLPPTGAPAPSLQPPICPASALRHVQNKTQREPSKTGRQLPRAEPLRCCRPSSGP